MYSFLLLMSGLNGGLSFVDKTTRSSFYRLFPLGFSRTTNHDVATSVQTLRRTYHYSFMPLDRLTVTGWEMPSHLIASKALGDTYGGYVARAQKQIQIRAGEISESACWRTQSMAGANVLSSTAKWMTCRRCASFLSFLGARPANQMVAPWQATPEAQATERLLPIGISPKITLFS